MSLGERMCKCMCVHTHTHTNMCTIKAIECDLVPTRILKCAFFSSTLLDITNTWLILQSSFYFRVHKSKKKALSRSLYPERSTWSSNNFKLIVNLRVCVPSNWFQATESKKSITVCIYSFKTKLNVWAGVPKQYLPNIHKALNLVLNTAEELF